MARTISMSTRTAKTKFDVTRVHPLARPGCKSGKIRFIHFRDGKEHAFYACVNDLTGSRMSWFDSDPPDVDESLAYVKSVFDDIRNKATKVLEVIGDF